MKVQVIYSSLGGCTKKLAQGIYDGLGDVEKSIHDLAEGEPALDGDILLLGYWVDKGGPNAQMKAFMDKLEGKTVGVFCTLAYWADAAHGTGSLTAGIDAVKEKNTVIGGYVCNGHISDKMIESFRNSPRDSHHSATPESELRWKLMAAHPTAAEIALGAERFRERVELYGMFQENKLTFRSIV